MLRGDEINLTGPNGPTVTGTANVMTAAVLAARRNRHSRAAREPEIADLGTMLISLGVAHRRTGHFDAAIRGVSQLGGGQHRVIPDRMETATLLLAVQLPRGT